LNCGRRLESAEFMPANSRWSFGCRCPSCGAVVSFAGEMLIVLGVLWPLVLCPFLLWLFVEDHNGVPENVGCVLLIALGITRMIERRRAVRRRKCESGRREGFPSRLPHHRTCGSAYGGSW